MNHSSRLGLRLLRMSLGLAALIWGVTVVGVFMSWDSLNETMVHFGAQPVPFDPMFDYWLRMTAGAFTLLGCWYVVLMLRPQRFSAAIPWFGGLMIVEGVILLVHGLRLDLPPFPFYADTSACLLDGAAICYLSRFVKAHDRTAAPPKDAADG